MTQIKNTTRLLGTTDPTSPARTRQAPFWNAGRLALVAAIALVVAAFFGLGFHRYFAVATLDNLVGDAADWIAGNRLVAVPLFMLIYAFAVVVLPPSGTVMTLTAGFLFGGFAGGTYVVVAATVGATALFAIAKTAFGDPLLARAGPRIHKLEDGFRRNAFSYLLILRLVPLFPFWLVNIAPAFLGVGWRAYVVATLIGIMPGTFVYASVGASLSQLVAAENLASALMTPQFALPALGLVVLALLPMLYRKFAAR